MTSGEIGFGPGSHCSVNNCSRGVKVVGVTLFVGTQMSKLFKIANGKLGAFSSSRTRLLFKQFSAQ
jgi:hypothetical protein